MIIDYIANKPVLSTAVLTNGVIANVLSIIGILNPVLGFVCTILALCILWVKLKRAWYEMIEKKIKVEEMQNKVAKHVLKKDK